MSKILIVDDDLEIAELLSDILVDAGFETIIRNNAEDALELLSNNFDLIILDIMLPGMSGTELCALIRNRVSCPIIFISAKVQTVDKLVGFEIGCDDYITKPFINDEVVARVKANIRQYKRFNKSESYLSYLKGKGESYRHWWLKTNFDYYDAKWIVGEYASKTCSIRINEAATVPENVHVTYTCVSDCYIALSEQDNPANRVVQWSKQYDSEDATTIYNLYPRRLS